MKKVIRLTESDLIKIVKRVINENEDMGESDAYKNLRSIIDYIYDDIDMVEYSSELKDLYMDLTYMENEIDNIDELSDEEYDMLMRDIDVCKEFIEYMSHTFEDDDK